MLKEDENQFTYIKKLFAILNILCKVKREKFSEMANDFNGDALGMHRSFM